MNTIIHSLNLSRSGISLFSLILCAAALSSCATPLKMPETQMSITNTSTYEMLAPKYCYYGEKDESVCKTFSTISDKIRVGDKVDVTIRAAEKIRVVIPFDIRHKMGQTIYTPNCHIMMDFIPQEESHYLAEAKIEALEHKPSKGFNCSLEVYEMVSGQKTTAENILKQFRYRIPKQNETPKHYESDYDWQRSL